MSLFASIGADIAKLRAAANKLPASDAALVHTAIDNVEKAVLANRAIVIAAAVAGAVVGFAVAHL